MSLANDRLAGGLATEMKRAVGVGDGLGEPQRSRYRPAGEHLLVTAEHERVQPQVQSVDQAETQERLHEVKAANDMDLVVTYSGTRFIRPVNGISSGAVGQ